MIKSYFNPSTAITGSIYKTCKKYLETRDLDWYEWSKENLAQWLIEEMGIKWPSNNDKREAKTAIEYHCKKAMDILIEEKYRGEAK